jgi:hypothetical protein
MGSRYLGYLQSRVLTQSLLRILFRSSRNGTKVTRNSPAGRTYGPSGLCARRCQLHLPHRILMIPRRGWKIRPADSFKGPVGAKTSFPIMFIGNIADATTPLRNAQTMSKLFKGSSILAVDTPGVRSSRLIRLSDMLMISSAHVSRCPQHMQRSCYPKTGTVCPIDTGFFQDPATNASTSQRRDDLMALRRGA